MTRQRYNLYLVLAAAVGLIAVHELAPRGLYSFDGRRQLLFDLVRVLLWMLFVTHISLAAVLWMQRRRWDRADAASFLFVSAKAIFWGSLALTSVRQRGESLTTIYLFFMILLSTLNLDLQLFRRYVVFRADEQTDARRGDAEGTAHNARMVEHGEAWRDQLTD
jgi:Mlc titration factor MtfA (ptsG expression regulator)